MIRLKKPLKKIPELFKEVRISLNNNSEPTKVNLYFQDESRFGLKTHVGRCITARGVKPIVKYQHAFKNTYLYGSFSPIDGDAFVYEIEGVSSEIFHRYLLKFSEHRPEEHKIVIIDNASFHSLKQYSLPSNITLIRIPPYTPELNPAERIWRQIKKTYSNNVFEKLDALKAWLHDYIAKELTNEKSIMTTTHYDIYNNAFNAHFVI